ncbi:hypothetical protein OL229_06635 [Neisseriaceae bacterium JH1-16]|nr:hypothetical protein [Neisseriaceae bacterium JH1-16]
MPNLGYLTCRLRELNNQVKKLEVELEQMEAENAPAVNITDEQILEAAGTFVNVVRNTEDNKNCAY